MVQSTFKPINILGTQSQSAATPSTSGQVPPINVLGTQSQVPPTLPAGLAVTLPEITTVASDSDLKARRFMDESRLKRPDLTALRRFNVREIYSMDKVLAEQVYFNGRSDEETERHKQDIEDALFFVSGSKKELDEATQTYLPDPSFYKDGIFIEGLVTAQASNDLTFSPEKGSRIQNMLARNAVFIAVPTDEPADPKKGIVPMPVEYQEATGYSGNIMYKAASPYYDNIKMMGGQLTDEGIVLPSENLYRKLQLDYFGNRADRVYGAKHTEAGLTEIEKRFILGIHEAGGKFETAKKYGRFMFNAAIALDRGSRVFEDPDVPFKITGPAPAGLLGVAPITDEQVITNSITADQARTIFSQDFSASDLKFDNPKVRNILNQAAMHLFNTEIVRNPEKKHMIMPDGLIKSEYIPSASEVLQENLGVSPTQANTIIDNNRNFFGDLYKIGVDAIPYLAIEGATKYTKGIKNVGVVTKYIEELYGTKDIRNVATAATFKASKGMVPKAVSLPQIIREAHKQDIGQQWLMSSSTLRNLRLNMRIESTYRGLGYSFGRAATIGTAVDQTIKQQAEDAYLQGQRLIIQANNSKSFVESTKLRAQAWAATRTGNIQESRLYVPDFMKEAIGDEYYLAFGVMGYENGAEALGVDDNSAILGLGSFGAGFMSMAIAPQLAGTLTDTLERSGIKILNVFKKEKIEERATIFADVLDEFTSLRRREAQLTDDGWTSSVKNFFQASRALNPLGSKTARDGKKLFAFIFGDATPEEFEERMGVIDTFVNAQNVIRSFKDLDGNALFEDSEFPVLMADVFGLQGVRSLTEAVADRRKASSIMSGDAFGLEKTVIEKRQEALQRFTGFFEKLKPYMDEGSEAFDADVRALLDDVQKLYVKEKAEIQVAYDRLMEEWTENTKILREGIVVDHLAPRAGNQEEIDLDLIDDYFNNLEESLVMKNTDIQTGVLNTKQLYEDFVKQSDELTQELARQAELMTDVVGTADSPTSSALLVNTAKASQKANKRLANMLYKRIEQVDPSVRIDIDFLVDAVDDNKLLKDFVSDEVDIARVDVAAMETAIKPPATKKHHQFFNEAALDTMRKSPIGQAFGIDSNASSEETFQALNGFVDFIQEAKAERGLDVQNIKTPLDQYRFFKKLFTDDVQLLQELFPDMGDVSNLKAIGENLKLTASPLQYKNLRQSFTVRAGKEITASDKAAINARNLLNSRMEDPETGFKSNMLGGQPEDVSEEIRELFRAADTKYSENMLRYGRGTKTYNVVNSSINNSKNLPHEAFDKLFDPVVKKINEKSILTREIDTVLDQELTVELARMFGGKFYGTGEDRRPYLIVDSSAARKSANLILAKIREYQLHSGVGALVKEATETGRAIVAIDMDLEDGIRIGSVLNSRSSHRSLGVQTERAGKEGQIKRNLTQVAEEFNKKTFPLINILKNIKTYKELPDGSLDLANPIPLLTDEQVNEAFDFTRFVHSKLSDDLRLEGVVKAQKKLHSRLTKEIDTVTALAEGRKELRDAGMATITGYMRGLEGDVPDATKVFINMITERGEFSELGGIQKLRQNFIDSRPSSNKHSKEDAAEVFDKLLREALVSEVLNASKTTKNTLDTAAFTTTVLENTRLMAYLKEYDPDLHTFFEATGIMLGVLNPTDVTSVAIRAIPGEMQFGSVLSGFQAVTSGRMGLNHMIGIMVAKQASLNELNNFHDMAMNPELFSEMLRIINRGGIPNSNLQSALADRMIRSMAEDIYREESGGEIYTVSEGLMETATGITNMLRTSIPEVLFEPPEKLRITQ